MTDLPHRSLPSRTVRLRGDLDVAAVAHIRDVLAHSWDDGPGDLLLELDEVTFIDCAGLRALLWGARQARHRGGRLRVVDVSAPVDRLLRATSTAPYLGHDDRPVLAPV